MKYSDEYKEYLKTRSEPEAQGGQSSALGFLSNAAEFGTLIGGAVLLKKGRVAERLMTRMAPALASSRPLFETIGAFNRAAETTINSRHLSEMFGKGFADDLGKHFGKEMTEVEKYRSARLGGGLTNFETLIEARNESYNELIRTVLDDAKIKKIFAGIEVGKPVQTGNFITETVLPALKKIDQKKEGSFFRAASEEKIAGFVRELDLNMDQKKIASDLIYQNIKKYENTYRLRYDKFGFSKTDKLGLELHPEAKLSEKREIIARIRRGKNIIDEDLARRALKEKDWVSRAYTKGGLRNLTVGEYRKLGLFQSKLGAQYGYSEGSKVVLNKTLDFNKETDKLLKRNKALSGATVDPRLFVDRQGKIVDLRHISKGVEGTLDFMANNFQIPIANINPVRMAHWYTQQGIKKAGFTTVFRQGTKQPFIQGTDVLEQNLLYSNGKVYDITTGSIVKDQMYLMSTEFGMGAKMGSYFAGYERPEVIAKRAASKNIIGMIQNVFDVGRQEAPSALGRLVGWATRNTNYKYGGTALSYLQKSSESGIISNEVAFKSYDAIYNLLNNSPSLSPAGMERLASLTLPNGKTLAQVYGLEAKDFLTTSNEDITKLFTNVMNSTIGKESPIRDVMNKYVYEYMGTRDIGKKFHTRGGSDSLFPGFQAMLEGDTSVHLVNRYEDITKAVQMDMLYQADMAYRANGSSIFENLSGFTKSEANALTDMSLINRIRGMGNQTFLKMHSGSDDDLKSAVRDFYGNLFADNVNGSESFSQLTAAVKRKSSFWDHAPGLEPPRYYSSPYIAVNKAKNPINTVNEIIKDGGSLMDIAKAIGKDTIGQLGFDFGFGFRAGRKHMEDVTTATMASEFVFTRLNDALSHGPALGLSNKSLGSPQDTLMNLLGRRYYLPMATAGYLGYANFMAGDPASEVRDAYTNATLNTAKFKDVTGITNMSKIASKLLPGIDQVGEWLPVKALKLGSFGLIGDNHSAQELEDYYKNGYDPIYQGRWWAMGSSTPYAGNKIEYYRPAKYRLAQSDYMMTDVMYGSRSEYYRHSPLITPHNPLGPITPLLLDPHHWEDKHREDRPYPVTGGSALVEDIPLLGPAASYILDSMGIIDSEKRGDLAKAHRKYIKDINEEIKRRGQASPGYVRITPGGNFKLVEETTPEVDLRALGMQEVTSQRWDRFSGVFSTVKGRANLPIVSEKDYMAPTEGVRYTTQDFSKGALRNINRNIVATGQGGIIGSAIGKSQIRDFRYRNETASREFGDDFFDIDSQVAPDSLKHRGAESYYSLTEIMGFYGFAGSNLTGGNDPNWRNRLASSTYMDTFGRRFWDANTGGLGGMTNEIFRRFVPRNTFRRQAYNPYRNTMPDWMPGLDYFKDFKHGDPYAMIPFGEVRLPGSGYEATHKLHPDLLGQYGVLDRFMILGDVAPYSDQYKLYKSMIPSLNLSPEEKAEVKAAAKRVANAKKKYRLYPYKFSNAEITKKQVTVSTILDDTTFLTDEFPDNPIRLAGINFSKSKDPQAALAAQEEIKKLIRYGNRITIGIDADATNRIKNDVMGTIHAAVYYSDGENRGKTLQIKLLREGNKSVEEKESDDSAASIHARFYKSEITLGSVWERFAHLDTPFHTKFLQVRSPLEMYERKEVYGKSFQSWRHPIRDILMPTLESYANNDPITAMTKAGILGLLVGSTKYGRVVGATGGILVGGTISSVRSFNEAITGEKWIPQRRRQERDINEYFDMLKYVKYQGLYKKARKLALEEEGVDVDEIIRKTEEDTYRRKRDSRVLKGFKKWMKVHGGEDMKAMIGEANRELNSGQGQDLLVDLGPIAMQALQYKMTADSTLYGIKPGAEVATVIRALPSKDREFYNYFIKADDSEKQKILDLVPKNQRKLYQSKWGMKVDKQETPEEYFSKHALPDASWAGWSANINLDDVKIKVIKQEGLDATEFGFWPDDEGYAASAPAVDRGVINPLTVKSRLQKVLRGAGLKDVDVLVSKTNSSKPEMSINFDFMEDVSQKFKDIVNDTTAFTLM